VLKGDEITGTFGDAQDQSYWPWTAKREGQATWTAEPGGQAAPPVQPTPSSVSPAEGTWTVAINDIPGTMVLARPGEEWTGTLDLDAGPEQLSEIAYDDAQHKLRFIRPSVDQHYVGVLNADEMTGTFGDAQDQTYWPWTARRAGQ